MAYRLTGNRDDAEDLTQEAYLRAYRSFATYNRQLPFESWFFRILSNLFIDLLRRRPRQKPLSLDQPVGDEESEENLLLQIADEEANPERSLIDQVMDERIQNALATLPEAFRVAVLLCDVEGKSYEEVAAIMGSSIGTVRSRIHRGRTMLRRALDSQSAPKKADRGSKKRPALLSLPLAA
jgi:RNA polymerase sigma-70 factor (ECF subfamily)